MEGGFNMFSTKPTDNEEQHAIYAYIVRKLNRSNLRPAPATKDKNNIHVLNLTYFNRLEPDILSSLISVLYLLWQE